MWRMMLRTRGLSIGSAMSSPAAGIRFLACTMGAIIIKIGVIFRILSTVM